LGCRKLASLACLVGRIVRRLSNLNVRVPSSFCGASCCVDASSRGRLSGRRDAAWRRLTSPDGDAGGLPRKGLGIFNGFNANSPLKNS
jgi:hypothetical protein